MFELKHPKNGFRLINSLLGIRKNNFFSEKKIGGPPRVRKLGQNERKWTKNEVFLNFLAIRLN